MTKQSNRRRAAVVALAGWLSVAAGGCAVYDINGWKMPEARIPDVNPIMRERNDDAVRDFDRRRNEAQFLAAQTSWRHGDYVRCRESLEKILDRDPRHRPALLLLADLHLEQSEPAEAVDVLRRVLAEDPQNPEVAYRLGVALETIDKFAEALPYLTQAAAAAPDRPEYAEALAEARRELNLDPPVAPATNTPSAKAATVKLVEPTAPQELPSTAAAPLAQAAAGESPAPSPPAVAENPQDPEFAAALADWEQNHVPRCAERLKRILERDADHVEANILQAELDLNGGQTAAALQRMDRLVLRHPRNVQVRQACGLVNEAAGEAEKAATFFREAEALAEADALVTVAYEAPLRDGAASTPSGDVPPPPEVPNLATAPEVKPAPLNLNREPAALLADGCAQLEAGRTTEARALLKAAVDRSGHDAQTAATAAVTALKLEQPALALELAASAATVSPRSAPLHRIRGMAAYRLGRYSEAEAALQQSLNLDKSQALSYFLLGSAQSRLGKTDTAERNLREAARLDARYAVRR